jgi:type IV pilus secretin PilQ/predicted competence protein
VNGAETKMTMSSKARVVQRLIAGCAIAAAVGGGLRLMAAPAENIRLVGVSSQMSGRTAAVLIESTEPVAYSVSRPDPLTVLVDLRNVTVGDTGAKIARRAPLAGVALEQATAIDGQALARVRVTLTSPSAYKVRSARNVIRLEIDPDAAVKDESTGPESTTAAVKLPAVEENPDVAVATRLEKVRTAHRKTVTTITLEGNGRLSPSALTEADGQPRRLVLDFPNVTPAAAGKTSVDSTFVKEVRVSLNSHDPLVTRVIMDVTPAATYHVERTGAGGRDLAVVFEGPKAGAPLLIAPGTSAPPVGGDDEDRMTMAQALANAASLVPRDPITALVAPPETAARQDPAPAAPKAPSQTAARKPAPAPTSAGQPPQNPPALPPQNPPPPPQNPPAGQSTFTADVPGSGQRQYVGAPVNFDFEDADLRAVLRLFSQFSGLNMIIDPAVQGRVNVLLNDVPWDQALEQILRSNKLGYSVDGNIMRIAPLAVLADEQAQTQKLNDAKALAGELQVKTFPLSYAKADAMAPLLTRSALSARGQIQVDARTNTLIVMDLPDRLQTAQSLIGTLDKPQPQVEVEARVIQTSRDFARALGIQWGFNGRVDPSLGNTTNLAFPNNGSLGGRTGVAQGQTGADANVPTAVRLGVDGAPSAIGLALGSINGAFNLDVALSALERSGNGRLLSTPRVTTQNNIPAEVTQGVQIPYQTVSNNTVTVQFKDAALTLRVTPQITAVNTVIMQISVENASPDFGRSINQIPPINTQRANTQVLVSDGQTTVIGGIYVSNEQNTNDRTPGMSRLPLLGWLFKRESVNDVSTELLIFITPRIIKS